MKDLLLDKDGDIQFDAKGELVTGDATEQNQRLLLVSTKGSWREHPTVGVGLIDYLLGDQEDGDELLKEVQSQFEADGMEIDTLELNNNFELKYEARYVTNEKR